MENGDGAAVLTIFLYRNEPLLTSSTACLFVFNGWLPYAIFVEAGELFGAVYHETAVFYLYS